MFWEKLVTSISTNVDDVKKAEKVTRRGYLIHLGIKLTDIGLLALAVWIIKKIIFG